MIKSKLTILLLLLTNTLIISQVTNNTVSLEEVLESAINNHPLQTQKGQLSTYHSLENEVSKKSTLPTILWNTQARIQSESIALEFDNPMFPSIEIPLYSTQSTLDLRYSIYDGGRKEKIDALNSSLHASKLLQNDIQIEAIKKEVSNSYMAILYCEEKGKVLYNAFTKIVANIERMEAARKQGIASKESLLQLEIKKKEIENEQYSNRMDRNSYIALLASQSYLDLNKHTHFVHPEFDTFEINDDINKKELLVFDKQQAVLNAKDDLNQLKTKPQLFTFASAGLGYPNPLNFFDDNLGLFAMGGLGFKWNFYDWGKSKKESQLIQVEQEMLNTQKNSLNESINRYNEKFKIDIRKTKMLIIKEAQLIHLRKEISEILKKKMERGVIVPLEYLNSLNDVIDSELKLSRYQLELLKKQMDYQLLKGQL